MMEICELKQSDEKAWDEYVLRHSDSTFYHQVGWKNVVEKSYGHKPYYLLAKEDGEIKGVFPLFLMKSMLFGRKLVSVPFAPYGGICADKLEIESVLIGEAKKIVSDKKLDFLEIRNFNKCGFSMDTTNDNYVTFIIDLHPGLDHVWKNMRKDKKNGVKKAKKANISIECDSKSVNDFYDVYLKNMRGLGTPVHGYSFFQNIRLEFPDNTTIITIKQGETAICSKFLLFFKDTVISMWGATLKEYRKYHPYDLANWEAITISHANGYKYFDFGRCLKYSGVFNYKQGWRGKQNPLYYQFYLPNGRKTPDFSQNSPKRKMFAKLWSELPFTLTKKIGPKIRTNFP